MKRILVVFIFTPLLVFANDEKIGDTVVNVDKQNRVMNQAIRDARASLDDFLELFRSPPAGATNFKLKVMMSDDSGVEHFWFIPFKEIEGGFAGILANEPSTVKSVTYGELYAFTRDQITDWGYEMDGRQYGSYTVCALFQFMEEELVAAYKSDYGFTCEP